MPLFPLSKTVQFGELDDHFISFNFKRSTSFISRKPRPVIVLASHLNQRIIIPGINQGETGLIDEIKSNHQWDSAKQYSFKQKQHLFSFLWRFRDDDSRAPVNIQIREICSVKESKLISKTYHEYLDSLNSKLCEGQVFLMPDREVNFNQQRSEHKPYSRRVLVFKKNNTHITMVPLTSKVRRHICHRCQDILFDAHSSCQHIDPDGQPAIESFPYSIFNKQLMLCVFGAQPMTVEDFLMAALKPLGSVRKELLAAVSHRMKKNG